MGLILADTDIVIYTTKGIKAIEPYLDYDFAVSDITVIELLGVNNIDNNTLGKREKFLQNIFTYLLNLGIRETAIRIKQNYVLKIPDAIIAATAVHYQIPLITADKDFKKIKELSPSKITL